MDLLTIDDIVYNLQYPNEDKLITLKIKETTEEYIQDVAYRALSVLSLCKRVENVQVIYQDGLITDFIGMFMKKEIQKMCNQNYKLNEEKGGAPPIFLMMLYRGYDMLTPFMRNNSYGSLFYEMLEKTDNLLEYEMELESGEKILNSCQLNEDDNIWQTYKHK